MQPLHRDRNRWSSIQRKPSYASFVLHFGLAFVLLTSTASAGHPSSAIHVSLASIGQAAAKKSKPSSAEKQQARDKAIRAIAARLDIGVGDVVADIGAGKGQHTWTLADIVGPEGAVYAEEITDQLVDGLKTEAAKRELPQVRVVKGDIDSPCLPDGSIEMGLLRFVYHHFGKPREMLRGIRKSLKPGGYLVIVDQRRGTLEDWIPREERTKKHAWLAETTVVREAREEGFSYVGCAEDCWDEKEPFVLIFQRPENGTEPGGDPDSFEPLPENTDLATCFPNLQPYQRPAIIALGPSRQLIKPILSKSNGAGIEIVLEEWATQKDERPPLPAGVELPSTLTEKGDPKLADEVIDAVFFLDAYHLMFHGPTLLKKLHERLAPGSRVYILDRKSDEPLDRREASHQRRIVPQTVCDEMVAAGFELCGQAAPPVKDRFVLVFFKGVPR